jgi:hypothetical protein
VALPAIRVPSIETTPGLTRPARWQRRPCARLRPIRPRQGQDVLSGRRRRACGRAGRPGRSQRRRPLRDLGGYLPCVRTFGKSTSVALGLPTQTVLGAGLVSARPGSRASETNSYASTRPTVV